MTSAADPYFERVLGGLTGKGVDVVMAVGVLEHGEDLDATIAACAGALRLGGVLGFLTYDTFVAPEELAERMAAHGLQTADVLLRPGSSYVGYAVKI